MIAVAQITGLSMTALFRFIGLTVFSFSLQGAEPAVTEVVVIPSIHGAHKDHPTYDYEVLFSLVETLRPDFVGVEIRPEDIGKASKYLSSNYPHEMVELSRRYAGRVFGVDWLGAGIVGQAIPAGYFANLEALKLMAALDEDPLQNARKPDQLAALESQQTRLVELATPASLADGRYGQMCREIDRLERAWLAGTIYEDTLDFNQQRDAEIAANIIAFLESNRSKRVVLVLGADHRTFAVASIREHFGPQVSILPVPE